MRVGDRAIGSHAATSVGLGQPGVEHARGRRGNRCRRPARCPRARRRASAPRRASPHRTSPSSSARTASPSTTPVAPFDARGDVDGHDRHVGLVQARDRRRPVVLRHAAEPGAEDRVHGDVRSRELAPEAALVERSARRMPGPRRGAARSWPPAPGARRGPRAAPRSSARPTRPRCRAATSPSPPLFPLPQTTTARRPYAPPASSRGRPRHGSAGPLHQHRRPRSRRACVSRSSAAASSGVRTGFIGPRSRTPPRSSSRG